METKIFGNDKIKNKANRFLVSNRKNIQFLFHHRKNITSSRGGGTVVRK